MRLICFCIAITLFSFSAMAADSGACHRDAMRFCAKTLHGDKTQLSEVAKCLVANKHKLSGQCRAVLKSYGI